VTASGHEGGTADRLTFENELVMLRPMGDANAESDPHAQSVVYADAPAGNGDRMADGPQAFKSLEEPTVSAVQRFRSGQPVCWAVVDQSLEAVVGTVSLFGSAEPDGTGPAGRLEVELQSPMETRAFLYSVLTLCLRHFYSLFGIERMRIRTSPSERERLVALEAAGFVPNPTDPREFFSYVSRKREGA